MRPSGLIINAIDFTGEPAENFERWRFVLSTQNMPIQFKKEKFFGFF
jgi:hypothetical protein